MCCPESRAIRRFVDRLSVQQFLFHFGRNTVRYSTAHNLLYYFTPRLKKNAYVIVWVDNLLHEGRSSRQKTNTSSTTQKYPRKKTRQRMMLFKSQVKSVLSEKNTACPSQKNMLLLLLLHRSTNAAPKSEENQKIGRALTVSVGNHQ